MNPLKMVIPFRKILDEYGWLSNMSRHPITYNNERFHTAEHLFQCLRLKHHCWAELMESKSPILAKRVFHRIAKEYPEFVTVEPRTARDMDNMRRVLLLKLESNPDLIGHLMNTGDLPIVEDVTFRRNANSMFWGAAQASLHDDAPVNTWIGENHLGKMWMWLRECYKTPSLIDETNPLSLPPSGVDVLVRVKSDYWVTATRIEDRWQIGPCASNLLVGDMQPLHWKPLTWCYAVLQR